MSIAKKYKKNIKANISFYVKPVTKCKRRQHQQDIFNSKHRCNGNSNYIIKFPLKVSNFNCLKICYLWISFRNESVQMMHIFFRKKVSNKCEEMTTSDTFYWLQQLSDFNAMHGRRVLTAKTLNLPN